MSDAAAAAPALLAAFRTDPGRVRANNEDVPLVDAERGVFGVIDGIGGQAAGELAAAIAHDVILQRLSRPLGTAAERAREAIAIANNEIFRRAGGAHELSGMTCVVTLAIVSDGRLTIGHVGDSRLYKIRPDGLQKLTHDHSPVGEREDAQEISELAAMRHPRRHEVFRDVGGALRDKDEADYVEITEQPLERDAAILLCTDGLTDMVASTTIDRLVRQHAGDPRSVVDSLVDAANQAGGRDNVTVVYAEGPDFARSVRGRASNGAAAAPPPLRPVADTAALEVSVPRPAPEPTVETAGGWSRFVGSRITWFAAGLIAGVLGALLLVWRTAGTEISPPRTVIVSATPSPTAISLADALRTARAGDTIQLERGTYAERVSVPDGVNLLARVPGSVTFGRPAVSGDSWTAIETAGGDLGGRIAGIRLESTAELPIDVGIKVIGQGWSLELLEITGPMHAAVEVAAGATATLSGSHVAVPATPLVLGIGAQMTATGNTFAHQNRITATPATLADGAQVAFKRNVFIGFGADVAKSVPQAERQQFLGANVIVNAEPSAAR
ncbi:MAG: protein phosphatase 2C domain-containing protein [Vicinamibacterales bacterium]